MGRGKFQSKLSAVLIQIRAQLSALRVSPNLVKARMNNPKAIIIIPRKYECLIVGNDRPLKPNKNPMFGHSRQSDEARHFCKRSTHFRPHALQLPPIFREATYRGSCPVQFLLLRRHFERRSYWHAVSSDASAKSIIHRWGFRSEHLSRSESALRRRCWVCSSDWQQNSTRQVLLLPRGQNLRLFRADEGNAGIRLKLCGFCRVSRRSKVAVNRYNYLLSRIVPLSSIVKSNHADVNICTGQNPFAVSFRQKKCRRFL